MYYHIVAEPPKMLALYVILQDRYIYISIDIVELLQNQLRLVSILW